MENENGKEEGELKGSGDGDGYPEGDGEKKRKRDGRIKYETTGTLG